MGYSNINATPNYQLQGFGQSGMRTISTSQAYVEGEYYRVLVATQDSTISATSVIGDDITDLQVYAGTTIYGLFTAVSVSVGEVTAYLAGVTDIESVWSYINTYGLNNGAIIEAADCAKDAIEPLLDKYYAQASLVLVPSLYKTSVVYAERPLDANGQLTFTRASEATRVGPDGYVEKVRTNLILQSETFNNASWSKVAVAVTENATTAPNGATTAEKLIPSAVDGTHQIFQSGWPTSGTATFSVYAKDDGYGFLVLRIVQLNVNTWFDLNSGVVGITGEGVTASILPIANGWYRCSVTAVSSGSGNVSIEAGPSNGVRSFTGDGTSGIFIWGAQVEAGDIATDYIPTTTTAVSVGPVSNLPRLNYPINSDGSVGCPSLLLEPQRTNYQLYSENSSQWSTSADGLTVVYNTSETIDPSGYYGAEKVTSASGNKRMFNGLTNPSGALTMSAFVKKGTGDEFLLRTTSSSVFIEYNLTTLAVTATAGTGTITDYGNGWYRVTASTTSAIANEVARYQFPNADGEYIYFWGAMAENGAYATSYIPTLGASVTRVADACSKTGISSLIGQTEGTVFVEFNNRLLDSYPNEYIVQIISGTTQLWLRKEQGVASFTARLIVSGSTIWTFASSIVPINGNNKIAIAYKTGDSAVFLNGAQVSSTNTSAFSGSAFADLNFNFSGTLNPELPLSQALLFKTRLTNQQLQELTSL
jgi:hypothetical protein